MADVPNHFITSDEAATREGIEISSFRSWVVRLVDRFPEAADLVIYASDAGGRGGPKRMHVDPTILNYRRGKRGLSAAERVPPIFFDVSLRVVDLEATKLDALEAQIRQLNDKIAMLETSIRERDHRIVVLQGQVANKAAEIERLKNAMAALAVLGQ